MQYDESSNFLIVEDYFISQLVNKTICAGTVKAAISDLLRVIDEGKQFEKSPLILMQYYDASDTKKLQNELFDRINRVRAVCKLPLMQR